MGFDVVGIGGLCLDLIAGTTRIPRTDMMTPLLYTTCQGGGKVPTALVALSRLGGSSALFSTVGDDRAGQFCLKELADSGVNTDYIQVLRGVATNLTFGISETETGGRSFIGKYDMPGITVDQLDQAVIERAKYLHIWQFGMAERQAIQWVHRAGGLVVCDADRYSPELEAGIGLTDVFICSEFFFRGMYGDDAVENGLEEKLRDMAARGPRIAVVTLGARGYAGVDRAGFFTGEALSNIAVVDTTGAGDVFHGAFLCGLLRGWDARTTARFAAGVSAVKCTVLGGRAGIPDFATAQHFLDSGEIRHDIIDQWIAYYKAEAIF